VPVDNNASERAWRVVALFRKSSLYFGHNESGDNPAVPMTLIASCALQDMNTVEYPADVLVREFTRPSQWARGHPGYAKTRRDRPSAAATTPAKFLSASSQGLGWMGWACRLNSAPVLPSSDGWTTSGTTFSA